MVIEHRERNHLVLLSKVVSGKKTASRWNYQDSQPVMTENMEKNATKTNATE